MCFLSVWVEVSHLRADLALWQRLFISNCFMSLWRSSRSCQHSCENLWLVLLIHIFICTLMKKENDTMNSLHWGSWKRRIWCFRLYIIVDCFNLLSIAQEVYSWNYSVYPLIIKKTCSLAFILFKLPILISKESLKLFMICRGLKKIVQKCFCSVTKAFHVGKTKILLNCIL